MWSGGSRFDGPIRMALVAVAAVAACASDGSRCIPGASVACACTDGRPGAQVCQEAGTLAACTCAGNLPAAQMPGNGLAGDAGPSVPRDAAGVDAEDPVARVGDHPVDTICPLPSACWRSCAAGGGSAPACKNQCGLEDGVACWWLCASAGGSTSTCAPLCGAAPGCQAVLCWATCGRSGAAFSDCQSTCSTSRVTCDQCRPFRSAQDQCRELCIDLGLPGVNCATACRAP